MKELRYIDIENKKFEILISDEEEALLQAKLEKRASLAILKNPNLDISLSKYALLSYEDIEEEYIKKLIYRYYDLGYLIIENQNLRIREFKKEDYAELAKFTTDKFVGEDNIKFYNKEFFYSYIENQYPFYDYGLWAIERIGDKKLIGKIGINIENAKIYISYNIDKPYRKKGYAIESLTLLRKWISINYPGEDIYAKIDVNNEISLKIAKKLYFKVELFGNK